MSPALLPGRQGRTVRYVAEVQAIHRKPPNLGKPPQSARLWILVEPAGGGDTRSRAQVLWRLSGEIVSSSAEAVEYCNAGPGVSAVRNASEIAFFREHRWLVVEDAVAPAEIAEAVERMEVVLRKKHKLAYDWAWEKGRSKEEREFKIVQGSPSMVWPEIKHAKFRLWMIEFASRLMNAPIEFWYDQLLAKPPRDGAPTYWHQDEGYWGRNLLDRGITCWMPLHDVDQRNGCMHFIDRGHRDGVCATTVRCRGIRTKPTGILASTTARWRAGCR